MSDLFKNSSAQFSEDKTSRYVLTRIWDREKKMLMFVGLNPSTATASLNDRTITKVCKIAKSNNYGGIYMLNLFSYITAYPEELQIFYLQDKDNHLDIEYNNQFLLDFALKSAAVVCAWGSFKEAAERAKEVINILKSAGANLCCLKINANGSPKHPLYCKGQTKLVNYD